MNGFWGGQSEKCYVDVKVFNHYAASNKCSSLSIAYRKHAHIKHLLMANGSGRWNMPHSLLLFYQLLGGWLMKQRSFTNVWLLFYLLSGGLAILLLCAGFAAVCPFHCCAQLSLVSMVLDSHLITLTELLHQCTWSLI